MDNHETIAALLNTASDIISLTEVAMAMEGDNPNAAFGILLEVRELPDRAQARMTAARTFLDL